MGRPRRGTFVRAAGKLRLRIPITAARNEREETVRVWVDADPTLTDEQALELAQQMTEHFAGRIVAPEDVYAALRGSRTTTVVDFVRRVYLPTRREQDSYKRQEQWWNKHILPTIGRLDVRLLDGDHLRLLVDELDAKITDPATKFGWKTAWNVWGLVTRFCSDLAGHKDRRIRIRRNNPALGVRGPDRGDRAVKQWLYPSELARLLDCPRVPVDRRRRWALLVYFFARAGEVAALEWERVDLVHGLVTIDRAKDLRKGTIGLTKTHDVRVFPIEPVLVPLLRAMQAEGAPFGGSDDGAMELRRDLDAAGITREELFTRRGPSVPITQHDLRATGITYLAMRGESDDAIRERAGHTDFKTTQLYIRRGRRMVSATLGDPFDALPVSLLDGSAKQKRVRVSSKISSPVLEKNESQGKNPGSSVRRRGLEPLSENGLSEKTAEPETPGAACGGPVVPNCAQPEDEKDDIRDDIELAQGSIRTLLLTDREPKPARSGHSLPTLLLAAVAAEVFARRAA